MGRKLSGVRRQVSGGAPLVAEEMQDGVSLRFRVDFEAAGAERDDPMVSLYQGNDWVCMPLSVWRTLVAEADVVIVGAFKAREAEGGP